MADRFAKLLRSLQFDGAVFVSGGLAGDIGLLAALTDALEKKRAATAPPTTVVTHELAILAGAIGAALWGGFRYRKLGRGDIAWTATH